MEELLRAEGFQVQEKGRPGQIHVEKYW